MPKRTVVRDYLAERSFGEQVRIDMDRLDEECLQFPDDFFAASEAVTDAEERYMIRKAREDEIRTRMDMKVRNSPELYGLEKVTEPGVKAAIQASDKVKEAGEEQSVCFDRETSDDRSKHRTGRVELVRHTERQKGRG